MSDDEALAALVSEAQQRVDERDWPQAAVLASALCSRFPDNAAGYRIGAAAARETRRFDDAAHLLSESLARFPDQAWPLAEAAWTARARGDFDEVLRLSAELRSRFPDGDTGYRLGAATLRARGRWDEAEAVLREAAGWLPALPWLSAEAEAVTRSRRNRDAALGLVEALGGPAGASMIATRHCLPVGRRVVVVLGMHRTGTSLCTKIVQQLGVELGGPLLPPGFDNLDGYQELVAIVECHQALLRLLDADWDSLWLAKSPPAAFWQSAPVVEIADRLKRIVAEQVLSTAGIWAFKDPRTVHFLPLWKTVFDDLGISPVWVLSVRDPRAVAASLFARDAIPLGLGEVLWLEHYLEALRHQGSNIAAIVHYERWFSDPLAQLRALAGVLGGASEAAIEAAGKAIRAELRHNASDPAGDISAAVQQVFSWLTADARDLPSVQRRAQALWRDISALAPEPAGVPAEADR